MNLRIDLLIIVFTMILFTHGISIVYASASTDSNFTGDFINTSFNSSLSSIQLNSSFNSGHYISNVIDAGRRSIWNNLSWAENSGIILALADVSESIYKSTNAGSTWSLINDSFSDTSNNAIGLIIIDNTFLTVNGQANIWSSTDFGHGWTKINDDYNGGESNNPQVFTGKSTNIYIVEGDEDVWKSSNSGINWTKVSDDYDEGSSSANAKGITIASNGDIYIVANDAKVYKSTNKGINYTEITNDYNGGDGNSADGMTSDLLGNLYIMNDQDIWRSNNSGTSWIKVNDDFNPGDGNAGKAIASDIINNLYIADSSEDIFSSTDFGVTWTLMSSNMNGGDGDVLGIASYNLSSLKFQLFTYDNNTEPESFIGLDNSTSAFFTNSSFNELQIPSGRYLMYKAYFESIDSDYSPLLYNVTFSYTEQYNAPTLTINSPANNTIFSINNTSLSITIIDQDGDNMTVYFYGDNNLLNTQNAPNGSTVIYNWTNIKNGTHEWNVIIFDGTYNTSSGILNLFIDILPDPTPNVTTSSSQENPIDDNTRERYEGVQDRRYSIEYLERIAPASNIETKNEETESTESTTSVQEQQQNEQQNANTESQNTPEASTEITGRAVSENNSDSKFSLIALLTILTAGLVFAYTSGFFKKLTPEERRRREINKLLSDDKTLLEKLKSKIKKILK